MTITHGGPATHRPARATKPAGLTWRDQAAMVLVGTSTLVVVAVTSDWNWPLLGSVRSGILGAGILGLAACIVGAKLDPGSFRSSVVKTTAALGVGALALIIAGLVTGSEIALIWLAVVNVGLWILATARHPGDMNSGDAKGDGHESARYRSIETRCDGRDRQSHR